MNEDEVVSMESEITRHAAEHEVFLIFNGDSDAVAFVEWWESKGKEQYLKYLKKRRPE